MPDCIYPEDTPDDAAKDGLFGWLTTGLLRAEPVPEPPVQPSPGG